MQRAIEQLESLNSGYYSFNELVLHLNTDFNLQIFSNSLQKKTRTNTGEVPSRLNEQYILC